MPSVLVVVGGLPQECGEKLSQPSFSSSPNTGSHWLTSLRHSFVPADCRAASSRRRASANAFTASRCRDWASVRCR